MAHRILGVDLGTRAVKIAVLDKTLRRSELVRIVQERIAVPGDHEAIQAALSRALGQVAGADDVIVAGLPSAGALYRVLSFPFSDDKSLAESVGFEFESHIPMDLEDLLLDHTVVRREESGSDVLAVGVRREAVTARLATLRGAGMEPRRLGISAFSYATLLGHLPSLQDGTQLVLDIGASGTEAVFVEGGQVRYARPIATGSDAIRERFSSRFDMAGEHDDLLVSHAFLLPRGVPPERENERILDEATRSALAPWMRELRQTLGVWRRGGRELPDGVVLTGGMAGMRGLVEHVEQTLGLPVRTIDLSELPLDEIAAVGEQNDTGALAVALALQSTELRTQDALDFRQGDLAYEGDFKFLRQRIPRIAAFFVVALCLLGIRTTVNYRALVKEHARQKSQLAAIGTALTKKPARSFSRLKGELERPLKIDLASYYPEITAVKAFEDISQIVARVTEPPDFSGGGPTLKVRPPGPARAAVPNGMQIAQAGPAIQRGLPGLGGLAAPGGMAPPGGLAPPGGRGRGPGGSPGAIGPGAGITGGPGGPGGPGGAGDDDGAEKKAFEGHKVELLSIDIDRAKASLRGDCGTQDALLAFQQEIERHPCFIKVKSSSDRITFERHRDWFRFNIRFDISCPSTDEPAAGAKKSAKKTDASKKEAKP